jgi:hypothetical protein
MVAKSYGLAFDGYWREPNISGLPAKSAIYCAYACVHNRPQGTVTVNRLLYIGEAGDVRGRIENHECWSKWRAKLQRGEELCFSAALIAGESDRQRAEAAMIYKHKPGCNTEYVNSFPFDTTSIMTSGTNALLFPSFTVYRTENELAKAMGLYSLGR